MKTGYFVLPAKDIEGYKSKLISKDFFVVEKDPLHTWAGE